MTRKSKDPLEAAKEGWYRDPAGAYLSRWWDGSEWTEQTRPLEVMSTKAVTAFVLAICGLFCWITAIPGLWYGGEAWGEINQRGGGGKPFAVAAVVISSVALLIAGGIFVWLFFYGGASG